MLDCINPQFWHIPDSQFCNVCFYKYQRQSSMYVSFKQHFIIRLLLTKQRQYTNKITSHKVQISCWLFYSSWARKDRYLAWERLIFTYTCYNQHVQVLTDDWQQHGRAHHRNMSGRDSTRFIKKRIMIMLSNLLSRT